MSAPSVQDFTVLANDPVARGVYRLELAGNTVGLTNAGQFVNVQVPGFYLKRPFSIASVHPGRLQLIYKVLGEGTAELTNVPPGTVLQVLSGLGNGFEIAPALTPVVIGGGVGVVPLYSLVEELLASGQTPQVIYGFNTAEEIFLAEQTAALGVNTLVATVDGTAGVQGFVTDALPHLQYAPDYFYACGPTPMLRALATALPETPGQFSLEERMGCGFGACVGCAVPTNAGIQRVCKEGPVFTREQLEW